MGSEKKRSTTSSLESSFETKSRFEDMAQKKIRRVSPLGMRILVRLREDSNVTDGGLYLPEGAKDALAESVIAEVIEVAIAMDDQSHEETNISGIPLGTSVLIPKTAGVKVPWDDRIRIVDSKDVLGIITEVNLS